MTSMRNTVNWKTTSFVQFLYEVSIVQCNAWVAYRYQNMYRVTFVVALSVPDV